MLKYLLTFTLLLLSQIFFAQKENVLSYSEYIGYIKKHHPIVKQANLIIDEGEAYLMKARGAFDPKLQADFAQKNFQSTEYYDKLNAAFKIPTWYGVEVKGDYSQNEGVYLNPEMDVPERGLYSLGVSVSVLKGLLMNDRMATLKQAKLYQQQAEADNQLLINNIIYEASLSYFNWLRSYLEKNIYEEFVENARLRLQGIKRSYEAGEYPSIDTVEAGIALKNRILNLEKANLKLTKTSLEVSNYLWIDDVPVELQDSIIPDTNVNDYIETTLQIENINLGSDLSLHPKLRSLDFKYQGLEVERRLNKNNLLPDVKLQYNFLLNPEDQINAINTSDYKAGIAFSYPLFLRKERAELQLTNYKIDALGYERESLKWSLKNSLNSVQQEIASIQTQLSIARGIIDSYTILLEGEERKFMEGESSLFLINSRESKLIENRIKAVDLEYQLLESKGKLYKVLGTGI